jgi:hypothetical protein
LIIFYTDQEPEFHDLHAFEAGGRSSFGKYLIIKEVIAIGMIGFRSTGECSAGNGQPTRRSGGIKKIIMSVRHWAFYPGKDT